MKIEIRKIGLLPVVFLAIVLGITTGMVMPVGLVRGFITFNAVFYQLLGFLIPLIIFGLVTAAIADTGRQAGKLLLVTVAIAFADTLISGLLSYGVGTTVFPLLVGSESVAAVGEQPQALAPYFELSIPPLMDVMTALVFSFILGIIVAYEPLPTLRAATNELRTVVNKAISSLILPLLPLYIYGVFLSMTYSGQVWRILILFSKVIIVIFILHIFVLLYEFLIAGAVAKKNPLRLLWNMLPAYMTALGTSSSAATIPVTLQQAKKNGVSEDIVDFCIPLCATIHISGSMMKITMCAVAVCLLEGLSTDFGLFLHFILMLSVVMVAAPGVPGGAIMAALAPLSLILGFSLEQQTLMITLYVAMDSFGTACNVTGDGAIAVIVEKVMK